MEDLTEAYLSIYDDINEVKGFGGHVDPNTGKSSGLRSPSQQAHAAHWDNRRQGKDIPDPRRSKFKYGGANKSTTGAHEGDTPEGFAKKQNPDLAMTPSDRMKARAKSLELKGKGRQANKIRAVASRPNMQEDYMDEKRLFPGAPDLTHSFPLSPEEKKSARNIGHSAEKNAKKQEDESPTRSAARIERTTDMSKVRVGETFDAYDLVLTHLLDEGYCNSQESATKMMAAMSQDWINSIIEQSEQ